MKKLLRSMLRLGSGEAVSRLASFGLYAYISRAFGVELLGVLALSQTVATYVTLGTDQGLRMIGARLVSRNPGAAPAIMRHVLGKRLISCGICVSLGCAYALIGPVPSNARLYILGFVVAVIPYALSVDWLAWGLDHFGWLGAWRGLVGVSFAAGAVAAMHITGTTLLPITIANATSAVLGAALLWCLWRWRWQTPDCLLKQSSDDVVLQLRWSAVLPLGAATILNLMFNNFDTVILAAMTSASEVGRYNAAYKILFLIFGAYYLLTQSLYPELSRARGGRRIRQLILCALVALFSIGLVLALAISIWAAPLLRLIYGSGLGATGLLKCLSFAIPMDFCAALLGTVLVSRGYDREVLWCVGVAALCDISLNLWLVPHLKAMGSAYATVGSYIVLLVLLNGMFFTRPVLLEDRPAHVAVDPIGNTA